jgi:ABC-type uncharacterized transport system auxiliary subunit
MPTSRSYVYEPPRFMENNLARLLKLILAIGLMVALASVVGCGSKTRYPSYYVLNVPALLPANAHPKPIFGSVAVREFRAPAFLKEGPIVYRQSPEQIDFYTYHRWVEDPRRVVTAAFARRIQASGLFQSVDLFDGQESATCLLTGTLDHLEEVDQGAIVSVEVSISARLLNLRTGEVLWQDTKSKTTKIERRSMHGIVNQMSDDVRDVVEGLAYSMQARVSAESLAPKPTNTNE